MDIYTQAFRGFPLFPHANSNLKYITEESFLDCLTLEDSTGRSSPNVDNKLPTYAV
jgi:hypothetical protein